MFYSGPAAICKFVMIAICIAFAFFFVGCGVGLLF